MIYTPEHGSQVSNRMSPEKTREIAEMAEMAKEVAEALFELGMGTTVTKDEVEAICKRMEEDA